MQMSLKGEWETNYGMFMSWTTALNGIIIAMVVMRIKYTIH